MSSKTKNAKKIVSLFLVLLMMVSVAAVSMLAVSAEINDAVRDDANGIFQIRTSFVATGVYTSSDGTKANVTDAKFWWGSGTAFLINPTTVLTCAHVVNPDTIQQDLLDVGLKAKDIQYEVVLQKDVKIPCTLKKYSAMDDYAVLTLNEEINGKNILKLADSAKAKSPDKVYALGFPAAVTHHQLQADTTNVAYDKDDVTFTEGNIQKITNINNTDVIQHGCNVRAGNSGGPVVNEAGEVLGLVKSGLVTNTTGEDLGYEYATAINEVKKTLDSLGIQYTSGSGSPAPETEPTDDTKPTETTIAPTTEITTVAPTTEPVNNDDGNDMTKMIIIIAIIVLVIIIAVVVILIILSNKKKNGGNGNPPQRGNTVAPGPGAPGMGGPQAAPQMPRPQPPTPAPYRPAPPTVPSNEGAGETSVLNDGVGETTVLGAQTAGYFMTRKRNGEKININKSEFLIGKERRRVDYCIGDNNSVSRVHAKIKVRAGRCYISDMGSTNCTYVNGTKLNPNQEVILSKGDQIKVSDEEFEFLG